MRVLIITVLCLLLAITAGCTGASEGNQSERVPDKEIVVTEETSQTSHQEEQSGRPNQEEVFHEVKAEDLGPFRKGSFINEMQVDAKYEDIVSVFKQSLTSWAAKDQKAFLECFISEGVGEGHLFLLEKEAYYEFVGTPLLVDQSSENGRINIIFSYRTSEQVNEISVYTSTFTKGKDGVWKIAMID